VKLEFRRTVQRRNHAQIVQAALLVGEHRSGPHLAPAVFGDQTLKVAIEIVGVGRCFVDLRVAEHLPANRHPFVVSLLVHEQKQTWKSGKVEK
jgi:hypothetical protein